MSDQRIRRSPIAPQHCNLTRSFDVLGDRWSLLILRAALYGVRRFDDFQAETAMPRTILSKRLKGLVMHGLLQTRSYRDGTSRARIEYELTKQGKALRLPFIALTEWGDRWLSDAKPPLLLKSRHSLQTVRAALVDEDGRLVSEADIIAEIDPLKRQSVSDP